MKLRDTNVVTVVLWQGKDGEPGLDVSNMYNKHLCIIYYNADGLHHQVQQKYLFFPVHSYVYTVSCSTCGQQ